MNHGILCFEGDVVGSRPWQTALSCGQFVAVYAVRDRVEGSARRADPWRESFVINEGPPLLVGDDEYGRYEPDYDEPFLSMCRPLYNSPPFVAVPREASGQDALATLTAFDALVSPLCERLFDVSVKRRKNADRDLGDLIKMVPLSCGWAYLAGFFRRPFNILLSDDAALLESFESVDPDRYYFSIAERW